MLVQEHLCPTRVLRSFEKLLFFCVETLPTMPTLLKYPANCSLPDHCINIPASISQKYWQFGILLLIDDTGKIVESIVHEHQRDAELINLKILQKWINGVGQPVSWDTLVRVLKDIQLHELARKMEQLNAI